MALFLALRDFVTRKEYEEANINKTEEEVEEIKSIRLKGYLSICFLGLGSMFWGGATNVLEKLHNKDSVEAQNFIRYFAGALLLMLVGTTAATFPRSSPSPMFFSGLGAWQAGLFMLVAFHLDTMEYYHDPKDAHVSMLVTSVLFTTYWAFSGQDPWVLHLIGRLVWWIVLSPLRFISFLWWFAPIAAVRVWKAIVWLCNWIKRGAVYLCTKARSPRDQRLLRPYTPQA